MTKHNNIITLTEADLMYASSRFKISHLKYLYVIVHDLSHLLALEEGRMFGVF